MEKSFYKIEHINKMDPFLMTITSGDNHWMYLSSTGCLTAGRKKAKYSLFPYVTDDLLHRNKNFTGPITIIQIKYNNDLILWKPFDNDSKSYNTEQNIYKNNLGDTIKFEEINHSLGLKFTYQWQSSEKYGFIKKTSLINTSKKNYDIKLIDGLRNIMPANIGLKTQQEMSNLANAYKVSEYLSGPNCALFYLNALLMDHPEPGESLNTNIIWSLYKGKTKISLDEKDILQFTNNKTFNAKHIVKGKPGCYLMNIEENLKSDDYIQWYTIADVHKTQKDLTNLFLDLKNTSTIESKLINSVNSNHLHLEKFIGCSDGFQRTNNRVNDLHHTANTIFNQLRGGGFFNNYDLQIFDFLKFLKNRNKSIFKKYNKSINKLAPTINIKSLIEFGDNTNDPSLRRLCREYLPLTMGRRHGDPSRPWNHFEIQTKDKNGDNLFYYEGNWRDIFQNWEALGLSYPLTLESMVTKFLNATSVDGYNPYRITSDGIDWEISEPDDPWSFIGYWNDHQIIYLLKLLEHLNNFDSSRIESLINESIFSYANIPYKIKEFEKITSNPKNTIDFDFINQKDIQNLVKEIGTDGKLILDKNNTVYHANLIEKVLVLTLAKICNLIPSGGIWLNTQRPEWNDANNALVGYGTSMVTTYYLKRFINFFESILDKIKPKDIRITNEVAKWTKTVDHYLDEFQDKTINDNNRFEFVEKLGNLFANYRNSVYNNGFSGQQKLTITVIRELFNKINHILDKTIELNKSQNGFFHSYNTLNIDLKNKSIDLENLDLMLEGQVAALSSGQIEIDDSIVLLESLFKSKLYRKDINSFILYPIKETLPFLEKNIIPNDDIDKSKLLRNMLEQSDRSIIDSDANGDIRFNPEFKNSFDLSNKLKNLETKNKYGDLITKEHDEIMNIYEGVFNHRNYTGRSGTMFSYEGIGSIYWHMVSKLLLAAQENFFHAESLGEQKSKLKKLGHLYYEIRNGLSSAKTPQEYGAFPFDPYSHSPSHSGAQQPGMTGQVKEEILTRFGELGCFVDNACILFNTTLLRFDEFLTENQEFFYYNSKNIKNTILLKKGQLAYTFCQVPIIYTIASKDFKIKVLLNKSETQSIDGKRINSKLSKSIFNRNGIVKQINISIAKEYLFND